MLYEFQNNMDRQIKHLILFCWEKNQKTKNREVWKKERRAKQKKIRGKKEGKGKNSVLKYSTGI